MYGQYSSHPKTHSTKWAPYQVQKRRRSAASDDDDSGRSTSAVIDVLRRSVNVSDAKAATGLSPLRLRGEWEKNP
jgi:hypothetical protein